MLLHVEHHFNSETGTIHKLDQEKQLLKDLKAGAKKTSPEFDEKLDWAREFVREEIIPLETLDLDLTLTTASIGD